MGTRTFTCQHCGNINSWQKTTTNKFCNVTCFNDNKWVTSTVPRIEAGLLSSHSAATLKKYLVKTCGENCAVCNQGATWNGKPLVLQLDHIDGNSDNNFPSNLRLICPNCHTQTDTFGAKGVGNTVRKVTTRNQYLREYKNAN